ncbi:MAG TPA: hypothetical protein VN458_00925 [Solirubrobacterales bacterium]|nr:hypothetical protein [Solirubrobacterales bacterium]
MKLPTPVPGASISADNPGALSRSGAYSFGAAADPFAVAGRAPSHTLLGGGFRGAR